MRRFPLLDALHILCGSSHADGYCPGGCGIGYFSIHSKETFQHSLMPGLQRQSCLKLFASTGFRIFLIRTRIDNSIDVIGQNLN